MRQAILATCQRGNRLGDCLNLGKLALNRVIVHDLVGGPTCLIKVNPEYVTQDPGDPTYPVPAAFVALADLVTLQCPSLALLPGAFGMLPCAKVLRVDWSSGRVASFGTYCRNACGLMAAQSSCLPNGRMERGSSRHRAVHAAESVRPGLSTLVQQNEKGMHASWA